MNQSEPQDSNWKQSLIYAMYAVAIYRLLDDLSDYALSAWVSDRYSRAKYRLRMRWNTEATVRKETGSLIWEAMEVVEENA